ncbi:hypothetical protein M409DRAFT_58263 [Zasmidium cellare ATCC 36951]|uniref:Uncharacterized protein n=1 Tax=Zasmidium cellare ATCC 36951 TaxID=1080233 RepID=A0A6A6C5R0_ZASCE|nr:uncharacterized protein M409DRAFT_58263 [Zasmidium cellare ATCC 36951]KAF2162507.1 hypothetical protein M409DRAFT_58263 [Zasmidium cellare ATCC 36951]
MSDPNPQEINCPFCSQQALLPITLSARPHFKTCSTSLRNDLRDQLVADREHDTLRPYRHTTSKMKKNGWVLNNDHENAAMVRIARMWRANELLGRMDYIAQLDEVVCFEDGTGTQRVVGLMKSVLSSSSREDCVQSAVAVEDALLLLAGAYNCYTDPSDDAPGLPKRVFRDDEREHLRRELRSVASIFEIAARFNELFESRDAHPWTISREMLDLQVGAVHLQRPGPEWDEEQEGVLLRLLGEGWPIVEVARRLNAEVAMLGKFVEARTTGNVMTKVDEVLVGSGRGTDRMYKFRPQNQPFHKTPPSPQLAFSRSRVSRIGCCNSAVVPVKTKTNVNPQLTKYSTSSAKRKSVESTLNAVDSIAVASEIHAVLIVATGKTVAHQSRE